MNKNIIKKRKEQIEIIYSKWQHLYQKLLAEKDDYKVIIYRSKISKRLLNIYKFIQENYSSLAIKDFQYSAEERIILQNYKKFLKTTKLNKDLYNKYLKPKFNLIKTFRGNKN